MRMQEIIERIARAAGKAQREADTHQNRERSLYCEGQAHGLRAAEAMLRADARLGADTTVEPNDAAKRAAAALVNVHALQDERRSLVVVASFASPPCDTRREAEAEARSLRGGLARRQPLLAGAAERLVGLSQRDGLHVVTVCDEPLLGSETTADAELRADRIRNALAREIVRAVLPEVDRAAHEVEETRTVLRSLLAALGVDESALVRSDPVLQQAIGRVRDRLAEG